MPVQVQGPDGNTYQFPEGTDKTAAIAYFKRKGIGAQSAAPKTGPQPSGTIGPAPKASWLDDAQNDLRQGGSRTIVGRTLGKMQGRGDKGYSGLESGVSKEVADFMGSPELGAVETAKGVSKMKEHPVKGAVDAVKGLAHMAEIPSMVMGGPATGKATEAVPEVIGKVLEKLPTATRGAKRLNEVEKAAGELPVQFNNTYEHLMRAKDLSETGATLPAPVKKFLKTFMKGDSIDYSKARDFYSNLSHLSAKDNMSLTPSMRRQVALIVQAMRQDIGDTAAQVDKAAQYYAGMKDYARAMKAARIRNAITGALKSKAIKTAVGAGAGYAAAKAIGKEIGPRNATTTMPGGEGDLSVLPAPIRRALDSAKVQQGTPEDAYVGQKAIASVDPGSNTIVVKDPKTTQDQTWAHEATHLWQDSLPGPIRQAIPADDKQQPYMQPQELWNLAGMRDKGMTMLRIPAEKQAQIVQAYVQYHKDPKMRAMLQPWIDDISKVPQGVIMPTSPDQEGINTDVRPPAPPEQNATDAWQGVQQ